MSHASKYTVLIKYFREVDVVKCGERRAMVCSVHARRSTSAMSVAVTSGDDLAGQRPSPRRVAVRDRSESRRRLATFFSMDARSSDSCLKRAAPRYAALGPATGRILGKGIAVVGMDDCSTCTASTGRRQLGAPRRCCTRTANFPGTITSPSGAICQLAPQAGDADRDGAQVRDHRGPMSDPWLS